MANGAIMGQSFLPISGGTVQGDVQIDNLSGASTFSVGPDLTIEYDGETSTIEFSNSLVNASISNDIGSQQVLTLYCDKGITIRTPGTTVIEGRAHYGLTPVSQLEIANKQYVDNKVNQAVLYKTLSNGYWWSLYTAEIYSGTTANPSTVSATDQSLCDDVLELFGGSSSVALTYSMMGSSSSGTVSASSLSGFSSVYAFNSSGTITISRAGYAYSSFRMGLLSNIEVN